MSSDVTEDTPKRSRRPRRRISYADRCQSLEREKAADQAKLGTVLTLLLQVDPAPGNEKVLSAAITLIQEIIG